MKRATLPVLTVLLLALAGCGSSSSNSNSSSSSSAASSSPSSSSTPSSSPPATSSGATGSVSVTMKNLAFVPASIHAKVGQTVQWVNDDTPPHNVTYVSGPKFTSSGTMDTGAKFHITLTQPGTIHYVCTIHPFMKATIVVTK